MLVTLRQMQYAIAVSETGSFSKAGELCSVEQSTVTQQIKILEDKIGVEIFNRKNKPIVVTNQGEELILKFKEILTKVDEMLEPLKIPRDKFH